MGFMDVLNRAANNISKNLENVDMGDVAQYGIIGAKIKQSNAERSKLDKPGEYCADLCVPNDEHCPQCMKLQRTVIHDLHRLEKMEQYIDISPEEATQLAQMKSKMKCSFCGAPIDSEEIVCPYCDTEYPEDIIDFDIPIYKSDRKEAMQKMAENIWNTSCEFTTIAMNNIKKNSSNDWIGKITSFTAGLIGSSMGMAKQNSQQIQQAADHYQVSLSEYITGALKGTYKTYTNLQMEQQNQAMAQQAASTQEYNERSRQIELERQEKVRKLRQENYQRQLNMINSRPAQYVAVSSSSCCGTCIYYYNGNECAYSRFNHTSGASDYCCNYRSR